MRTIAEKEQLFSFPKLEFFTNSIFKTPVKKEKELVATLSTLFITHPKVEGNSNFLSFMFQIITLCLFKKQQ